jgi:hypothetical protein
VRALRFAERRGITLRMAPAYHAVNWLFSMEALFGPHGDHAWPLTTLVPVLQSEFCQLAHVHPRMDLI